MDSDISLQNQGGLAVAVVNWMAFFLVCIIKNAAAKKLSITQ